MAVAGKNITVDVNVTGKGAPDAIRGVLRPDSNPPPKLREDIRRAIERHVTTVVEEVVDE